jgi:major membrane immunogen (membrane-anchored lipoprotein)
MRKQITFLVTFGFVIIMLGSCKNPSGLTNAKSGQYISGLFYGESRSVYTAEPFYGKVKLTICNGRLVKVDFTIRDSASHEMFDSNYEKHFMGNNLYIDQCRNDWKGLQSYPDSLLKYQELEKIDAISGATWSYNIFKASVKEALKDAKK